MSHEGLEKLWVEKYRPSKLSEYIFHDAQHESIFKKMIEQQSIPHLLLSGTQGTGKTTIAKILIDSLDIETEDILPPRVLDPALILEKGGKNYVITTWIAENEEPFEKYIREFTTGSLDGIIE